MRAGRNFWGSASVIGWNLASGFDESFGRENPEIRWLKARDFQPAHHEMEKNIFARNRPFSTPVGTMPIMVHKPIVRSKRPSHG